MGCRSPEPWSTEVPATKAIKHYLSALSAGDMSTVMAFSSASQRQFLEGRARDLGVALEEVVYMGHILSPSLEIESIRVLRDGVVEIDPRVGPKFQIEMKREAGHWVIEWPIKR